MPVRFTEPEEEPHATPSGLHRHGTGLVSTPCVVRSGLCGVANDEHELVFRPPSSAAGHISSLVTDSRSRVQRDTRARRLRQFRSRSPGANRLADLVWRGAQTL